METKHQVFNLIILDESGSMESIKRATINGFNEVVQTIQGVEKDFPDQLHLISFITFNGRGIKTLLFNEPVSKLTLIDESKYKPDSMTPLYDALGYGLKKQQKSTESLTDFNVLVTILTDGEENASKEFTQSSIKALIDELNQKNWTFTYIGANQDVTSVAASLSIQNTMDFMASEEGVKQMFEKEKKARISFSKKIQAKENTKSGYYDDDQKF
mgnify:CR=1 FL=1